MAKTVHEEEYRLIDRVSAGFLTIAAGVKGLSTKFTELNQAAELAGKGINLAVRAAQGIGDAVSGAADYEEAMRRVSERTNATAEDQIALRQAVIDAANEIGATADETATALLTLANDGGTASEAIDKLGAVLGYARAQARSAQEAAAGLGGILDSFGEKGVTSVAQVADALIATAKAAGTTADTLESGLSGIGVAAQQNNLTFSQTVAILGQLATRNIEGADAAKRLATILDQFQDPASKAGKALADVGLAGADFSTILQALGKDSDAAAVVLEALGKKPRDALVTLLSDGGGALAQMNAIIGDSEGAATSAAAALGGTFNDSLKRVQAQISILTDVAGGPILKPLADGLLVIATRLSEFAQSPAFDNLIKQFTALTDKAVGGLVEYLAKLDFEEAAKKVAVFAEAVSEDFDKIVKTITFVREGFNFLYETVGYTADSLVVAMDPVAQSVSDTATQITDSATAITVAFDRIANSAAGTSTGVAAIAQEATIAAPTLDAFGLDLQRIGVNFKATGEAAVKAADQIEISAVGYKALESALQSTIAELQAAQEAYKKAFESGTGADKAWAEVKRLGTAVSDLRKSLDRTKIATADVTAAFEQLGIQSQKALQESAQKGADAFQTIVTAAREGQATQEDVTRAFEEYAQRLVSTATLADESTRKQIRQQIELAARVAGVSDELVGVATASLEAGDAAEKSADRATDAWDRSSTSVRGVKSSIDDASTAADKFGSAATDAVNKFGTAADVASDKLLTAADRARAVAEEVTVTFDSIGGQIAGTFAATTRQINDYYDSFARVFSFDAQQVQLIEEHRRAALWLNTERQRGVEISRQEIALAETQIAQVQQQIALAGGIGNQSRPQGQETPSVAGGKGSGGGAGRDSVQVVQNVTINGLPTDRNSVRTWVSDVLLPELARLDRLSR